MAIGVSTIVLFDVDGTLLKASSAGRRALTHAFERLYGCSDPLHDVAFDGMTDQVLVRMGLEKLGEHIDPFTIAAVLEAYTESLETCLRQSDTCRILPGVLKILDELERHPQVAVGLGTGNIRVGAEAKLNRVGLVSRFGFGGFGCDAQERHDILVHGVIRGAQVLKRNPASCQVVVIGDTPNDIAAAHTIGARSLAVATGRYHADELFSQQPYWCGADLNEPGALWAILGD